MVVENGIYKHYKGKLYKVVGMARHSETLEEMVIYEAQYENELGKTWVRPAAMWNEEVETGGMKVPRFEKAG